MLKKVRFKITVSTLKVNVVDSGSSLRNQLGSLCSILLTNQQTNTGHWHIYSGFTERQVIYVTLTGMKSNL